MTIKHILTLLLPLSCLPVHAQDLKAELDVEQEIVPLQREAQRITLSPAITLPPITQPSLDYSDRIVTTPVLARAARLDPPIWSREMGVSPYRGYVRGEISPIFNAAFAAGYRLADNDRQRVSLFARYNGDVYRRGRNEFGDRNWWRDQEGVVALSLRQAIGKRSWLEAQGFGAVDRYNLQLPSYHQTMARGGVDAAFRSTKGAVDYGIGLVYRHFGYSADYYVKQEEESALVPKAQSDNLFNLRLEAGTYIAAGGRVSVTVNGAWLSRPKIQYDHESDPNNLGLIRVTPRYDFAWRGFSVMLGAELDIALNDDARTFSAAPRAMLAYAPQNGMFAASVRATGGSHINTLGSLYDGITKYCNAFYNRYATSHIPLDVELDLTFGPWHGAYLTLTGAWAKADDWLMPGISEYGATFYGVDVSSFRLGAEIGFPVSRYAMVRASYQATPGNSMRHAWYQWRDRARQVATATASIYPTTGLRIDFEYEMRASRRLMDTYLSTEQSLGMMSNLGASISYDVTDALTLSLRGFNLLDRNYCYIGDRPAQGASLLVGASFKF